MRTLSDVADLERVPYRNRPDVRPGDEVRVVYAGREFRAIYHGRLGDGGQGVFEMLDGWPDGWSKRHEPFAQLSGTKVVSVISGPGLWEPIA